VNEYIPDELMFITKVTNMWYSPWQLKTVT